MTCLAAAVDQKSGETYIGADSLWSFGSYLVQPKGGKIIGPPGKGFLIGYCGSVRGGQILARIICDIKPTPPPWNMDMAIDLAEYIKRSMEKHGVKDKADHDGKLPHSPTSLLIATPGRLFSVGYDYSVSEDTKWMANGSGRDFALGAFHVMEDIPIWPTRLKVEKAIQTACDYDPHVGGPIEIKEVTYKGKV